MNRRNIVFLGSLFLGILIVGMLYVDLFQTTVEGAIGDGETGDCVKECPDGTTKNEDGTKCINADGDEINMCPSAN